MSLPTDHPGAVPFHKAIGSTHGNHRIPKYDMRTQNDQSRDTLGLRRIVALSQVEDASLEVPSMQR